MKKITIILVLFTASLRAQPLPPKGYSFPSKNGHIEAAAVTRYDTTKTPLTLDKIKAIVSFHKEPHIQFILTKLVEIWYETERAKGKSEKEALEITLDKLGSKLLELGQKK